MIKNGFNDSELYPPPPLHISAIFKEKKNFMPLLRPLIGKLLQQSP